MATKKKTVIDLGAERHDRFKALLDAIEAYAEEKQLSARAVADLLLDETLGNTLVDNELEESLLISIAGTVGCRTKNPQHELNQGYDGNDEDDRAGDDLCDLCMTSQVNVDRTTYCGKTIGIECGCEGRHSDGTCGQAGCEACARGAAENDSDGGNEESEEARSGETS